MSSQVFAFVASLYMSWLAFDAIFMQMFTAFVAGFQCIFAWFTSLALFLHAFALEAKQIFLYCHLCVGTHFLKLKILHFFLCLTCFSMILKMEIDSIINPMIFSIFIMSIHKTQFIWFLIRVFWDFIHSFILLSSSKLTYDYLTKSAIKSTHNYYYFKWIFAMMAFDSKEKHIELYFWHICQFFKSANFLDLNIF